MGKEEILLLVKQVLEKMENEGEISAREFQLAVLLMLKWLLERAEK